MFLAVSCRLFLEFLPYDCSLDWNVSEVNLFVKNLFGWHIKLVEVSIFDDAFALLLRILIDNAL